MNEKNNGKSRTKKGVNGGRGYKEKKGDKKQNSVDQLLEKITIDRVIDAMVEYKWLVAKTIATHIIGVDIWDKLSEENKGIIIKSVNETKLKTSGLV